jgi:hypothetical protein
MTGLSRPGPATLRDPCEDPRSIEGGAICLCSARRSSEFARVQQ